MKKFLKSIYQFFLTIYIFESFSKFKRINKKGTSVFFVKSLNQVKSNKTIKKYFEKEKVKLNRFKNGSKFIGLKYKDQVVCSGWVYFGNKWKIEEINKKMQEINISRTKTYIFFQHCHMEISREGPIS